MQLATILITVFLTPDEIKLVDRMVSWVPPPFSRPDFVIDAVRYSLLNAAHEGKLEVEVGGRIPAFVLEYGAMVARVAARKLAEGE